MKFQPIIGLEVHVELATKSKMFCGCSAEHFGVTPNTHTCPVCLGLPGALPVPNKKAVEWTMMLGLALGCTVNHDSKFDRKNYFYPDLAKGYQISQYDEPLCVNGEFSLSSNESKSKKIRIRRVHLEEDTGKLQHSLVNGEEVSLVDFNRSGVPLVEIVTEPDFRSIDEVDAYLKDLQKIIRYLGISQADMEKGSMRLEPSISLTEMQNAKGKMQNLPPYRVELKNINSFRFARHALEFEIKRQTQILEKGGTPVQQTRGWNETKGQTMAQREKEEANDYRYFPEPDIPPMHFTELQIEECRSQIPELPAAKKLRFMKAYALSEYDSNLLAETRGVAEYFETAAKLHGNPKEIANWIINNKINTSATVPAELVEKIVKSKKVSTFSLEEVGKIIDKIILDNPKIVADYKSGKVQVLGFLIGLLAKSLGHAPTQEQRELLERKIT